MHRHRHRQHGFTSVDGIKKILLMGNPNVGKSVLFNQLTGLDVTTANYAGTTVSYYQGNIRHEREKAVLIDVPGVYSLKAESPAEKVATRMLEEGTDLIICVLDATHLERNLHLSFEIAKYNIPIIYVVNMTDIAKRRGLSINIDLLSKYLNAPVVETIATKGLGMSELKDLIFTDLKSTSSQIVEDSYQKANEISNNVLTKQAIKPSFLERLGDASLKPFPGILIAFIVLSIAVGVIVGGGMGLRALLFLPLVNNIYVPFITNLISSIVSPGMIQDVLIGEFGVLIKMIEWPFALILPYVFLFYVTFTFLEDSGYLPRLGVLMDGLFRKIGLSGSSIIPFVMGYGCAVPAVLSTRTSANRKERIIVVSLIAIAVPCTAQTGAFIAILGAHSIFALLFVYFISFVTIIVAGALLSRLLKNKSRPLILEIPNLLIPNVKTMLRKILIKLKHFLYEAQVPMFIGILLAAIIVETGLLIDIGIFMQPVVVGWLDLPEEATLGLLLGVIRRELAVIPLIEADLTTVQVITGSVVALFYIPCISVFIILVREFKLKVALAIGTTTFLFAFLFGGIIQRLLNLLIG